MADKQLLPYPYSIQNDTLNHKVASDSLTLQIQGSAISVALDHIDTTGDVVTIWFKGPITAVDETILNQIVHTHDGTPIPSQAIPFQPVLPEVSPLWMVSHNWCDKCTWWQESVNVQNEVMSQADQFNWTTANPFILDFEHARLVNEDDIAGGALSLNPAISKSYYSGPQNFIPFVVANELTLARTDSPPGPGQYQITSYEQGTILFGDDWTQTPPTISYNYARGSGYKFPPLPDKLYRIAVTEAKMSNVDMNSSTVLFSVFAGPVEVARRVYKSVRDYLFASIGAPQTWTDPVSNQVFTSMMWDYKKAEASSSDSRITIHSAKNMYIYMRLFKDKPFKMTAPNPYVVVTLYSTSEPDT